MSQLISSTPNCMTTETVALEPESLSSLSEVDEKLFLSMLADPPILLAEVRVVPMDAPTVEIDEIK